MNEREARESVIPRKARASGYLVVPGAGYSVLTKTLLKTPTDTAMQDLVDILRRRDVSWGTVEQTRSTALASEDLSWEVAQRAAAIIVVAVSVSASPRP